MKKIILTVSVLVLIIFLSGCELAGPGYTTKIYGLFIGLDYENTLDSRNFLTGTIPDTTEMAGAFSRLSEGYGIEFEGYLAIQEGSSPDYANPLYPTATHIEALIAHIGEKMNESDMFVVYYAGHGGAHNESDDSTGYIIPARESASSPSYPEWGVDDLAASLAAIPGKKVVILDSCNSGAFVAPYPLHQTDAIERYDPSQFYLTSTQIDEVALDKTSAGDHYHGYFTRELLNFLGWEHEDAAEGKNYTTTADFYLTSLEEKESATVSGRLTDAAIGNLPGTLTLEDLKDSVQKLSSQEAEKTSGPRDIILFH